MNTANLQLEGLYLAVAAMNNLLVEKGLLERSDVDLALRRAEAIATGDRHAEELSLANRDAMAFSIRLLRLANDTLAVGENPSFSDLARAVGSTKKPYNDQM
jgi:hypothetical protein